MMMHILIVCRCHSWKCVSFTFSGYTQVVLITFLPTGLEDMIYVFVSSSRSLISDPSSQIRAVGFILLNPVRVRNSVSLRACVFDKGLQECHL